MAIIELNRYSDKPGWSTEQSRDLYRIPAWSDGYFDISDSGHLIVLPRKDRKNAIDLYQLAAAIKTGGQSFPVLLRFTDILQHRVESLCHAFTHAMDLHGYQSSYTAVYPIKVNQQRRVVEDIIRHGGKRVGLEAGSKPELLTIIALSQKGNTVICNGYKDKEYIRIALIGQQLGLQVFIVIEKLSEIKLISKTAAEMGIKPHLGIRIRLASVAAGKWQNTGGEKSKFGLHSAQVIQAIAQLQSHDLLESLELLHFHIGSQVSNIQHFQRALHEGARFYAELCRMSAPVAYIDVGGGLGIDYEGTQSRNFCSVNYTTQAYADTVIHAFAEICRQEDLPQPGIITESGRAMTAHHAMLITNVIGIEQAPGLQLPEPPDREDSQVVSELWNILQSINADNAAQSYFDAVHHFDEAKEMFIHGVLDLKHRARVEDLYYSICRRVQQMLNDEHHDIMNELNEKLADKYFCNFSLFQSMPDSWAIDQIFPIVPLHRLVERPTRRAVIQDLTCDSDGIVNFYVDGEGITTSLPVHRTDENEPYLIGIFLLGAYQEILGDMHNLFGDTASVNVELTREGGYRLTEFDKGDTVADLLNYVHISGKTLEGIYKEKIASTELDHARQMQYLEELSQGLDGYTYLED